uniref:Transmembrane protein 229B n=1 Tax=Molossus molossus TaxID=27622 RepID=A0A7J8K3P8_MOLMO|nr:transmembrane protein 229B [Molossus molossus]
MLIHTTENGTVTQSGTRTKVNPGHSWTVILMSVLSCALKGVITGPRRRHGFRGAPDGAVPLVPVRHPWLLLRGDVHRGLGVRGEL